MNFKAKMLRLKLFISSRIFFDIKKLCWIRKFSKEIKEGENGKFYSFMVDYIF